MARSPVLALHGSKASRFLHPGLMDRRLVLVRSISKRGLDSRMAPPLIHRVPEVILSRAPLAILSSIRLPSDIPRKLRPVTSLRALVVQVPLLALTQVNNLNPNLRLKDTRSTSSLTASKDLRCTRPPIRAHLPILPLVSLSSTRLVSSSRLPRVRRTPRAQVRDRHSLRVDRGKFSLCISSRMDSPRSSSSSLTARKPNPKPNQGPPTHPTPTLSSHS